MTDTATPPTRPRRRRRWLRRTLIAVPCLLVALPLLAFALLQTGWGQRQLFAVVDGALADSELALHVGEISGLFPFGIAISELRLDDAEGTAIEAEDVRLTIGFWPLFDGDVVIGEFAAARLAVYRAPVTPPDPSGSPPEPTSGAAWPELPVGLSIDRLDIARLELGATLTGEDMALAIDGSFGLEQTAGRATLTIDRLEGRPARLALDARIDRSADTLALDLVATEPEGGVVPRLAGWDHDGPWQLTVKGDGPLAAWNGRVHAVAGAEELVDIAVSGALDLDAPRLHLVGVVSPPADLLPPEIDPMPIAIDLTASLGEDNAMAAGVVSGRGAAVTFDAAVILADPIAIDAALEVSVDDLAHTLAGLDLPLAGALDLTVDASGPLTDLTGTATVGANALEAFDWRADTLALALAFDGAPIEQTGTATLSLTATRPSGPDFDFSAYRIDALALDASVRADADTLSLDGLSLVAGPHSVAGSASLAQAGGPIGFDLVLGTEAAAALGLAGFDQAAGRLDGRVTGAVDPDAGLGWVEAGVDGTGLRLGDPALDALAGTTPSVRASGQVDVGYGLQGLDATIRLPAMTADVSGDLAFAGSDDLAAPLAFSLAIDDLALVAAPLGLEPDALAGSLTLAGTVGDPLSDAPRATVDLAGSGVLYAGTALSTLDATLAVVPVENGAILADLALSADGDYGPVRAAVEATVDPAVQTADLHRLNLAAYGSTVEGSVRLDMATLALDGTLQAAVPSLAALAPLTGVPLSGSASARITLDAGGATPTAAVALTARGLEVPDAAQVAGLTANVTITDPLGTPSLRGTVAANAVTADTVTLEEITIAASGTLDALDLNVAASGETTALDDPQPLALATDLRLGLPGDGVALRFASFDAGLGDERLTLRQPADLRLGGGTIALTGLDAALLDGSLSGTLRLSPGAVDVDLQGSGLLLGRAAALAGAPGAGVRVDRLAVAISGSGARPSGTVSLGVSAAGLDGALDGDASALSSATLSLTATLREGMVDIDASIDHVTEDPITLRLANALRLALAPFVADVDHGQPLDGALSAHADLAALSPFVSPSGAILLAGSADVDIAIGGVGGAPVFSGQGTIRDGRVDVAEIGLLLVDLNAAVAGDGDRINLSSLSAADPGGGTLRASGYADFGAQGDATLQVDTTFNQLLAFNTDFAEAQVTGALAVAGPLTAPAISGAVTVRPAEIRFAELPGGGYVEVEAIDVNGRSQVPPDPIDLTPPFAIPLDIAVSMPNALFVTGYGLDTEWSGNLDIKGSTANPVITGVLSILRGTMSLGGQPIEIGRGIVTFTGATPPDPLIDIEATSDTDGLRAILTIQGPASSADLELQSVPSLPQEEILGRLLFGAGRGGVSGGDAFQAGRALALLTGGGGDLGLVNTLRGLTGIAGLTIEADTDAEGNPAGRVGGYVSEDVYLSVSRGSATASGEAEISVEVLDGVEVNSSVTESGDSEIGLTFEWDY